MFDTTKYKKRIEKLAVNEIRVADYQRQITETTVKKIVNNFDPRGLGHIMVSHRDGMYWVFDGQHRLEAMKRLGAETIEAITYEGMDYKDEAKAWDYFNLKSSRAKRIDQANAELKRGETFALALDETVNECGLMIDYRNSKVKGSIQAYSSLEKIYKKYGREHLQKTLCFIAGVYGKNYGVFTNFIIEGFAEFFARYEEHENFDSKFLERRLCLEGLDALKATVTQIKKLYNKPQIEAAVIYILKTYNHNKQFKNQLS